MIHKTKGIVLKSIKFGETSMVVTVFTELFGLQVYMVNGVRSTKKSGKSALYQPTALLDMEVYHNELKTMQRVKEAGWSALYNHVLSDVIKNSIALYMVELLYKTLKQPEKNEDLFYFCENALIQLDNAPPGVTANFALFFSLHLTHFFGFKITNATGAIENSHELYLDLAEGVFTNHPPAHPHYLQGRPAEITAELLRIMQPAELSQLKLNSQVRNELLLKYQDYYALHIQDFGQMKTLKILHEILS